jgi:hypothetical protein
LFLLIPVGNGYYHLSALDLLIYNLRQMEVWRCGFREDYPQFFHPLFKLFKRAIHDELTGGEYSYLIGDSLNVAEDMGAEQNGSALLLDELDGKLEELPPGDCIKSQSRIVEDKQLRVYRHS